MLILGLGVRLPLRPFFLVSSVLIFYLAFKFVGAGIHALQVSGYLPATSQPQLPSSDLLGLFPTWETTAAQAILLLLAALVSAPPATSKYAPRGGVRAGADHRLARAGADDTGAVRRSVGRRPERAESHLACVRFAGTDAVAR